MTKSGDYTGKSAAQTSANALTTDAKHGTPRRHEPNPDMLDYVADMLAELKVLAESTQCETLTGLIALAAREAQLRHRNPR